MCNFVRIRLNGETYPVLFKTVCIEKEKREIERATEKKRKRHTVAERKRERHQKKERERKRGCQ
jgi:hypothetical protein